MSDTLPPANIRKLLAAEAEALIGDLYKSIDTLTNIANVGTANTTYIRSLATEIKRCVQQTVRLTRLTVDVYEIVPVGPVALPTTVEED